MLLWRHGLFTVNDLIDRSNVALLISNYNSEVCLIADFFVLMSTTVQGNVTLNQSLI